MKKKSPEFSIILCTRNRCAQLKRALEHYESLSTEILWELIVVNNGSSDQTESVLEEYTRNSSLPLKIFFQPIKGVSHAKNLGLSHARGDVVVFSDDDCYPSVDYLDRLKLTFKDSSISYCGGRVLLYDMNDRPLTLQESSDYKELKPHRILPSGVIHGANMAFRRLELLKINGFDERFGPGRFFSSGEDTDVLRRMSLTGYAGCYDPKIVVFHHHGRKTKKDEINLKKSYDRGLGAGFCKLVLQSSDGLFAAKHFYWHILKMKPRRSARQIFFFGFFAFSCRLNTNRSLNEHPCNSLRKHIEDT